MPGSWPAATGMPGMISEALGEGVERELELVLDRGSLILGQGSAAGETHSES